MNTFKRLSKHCLNFSFSIKHLTSWTPHNYHNRGPGSPLGLPGNSRYSLKNSCFPNFPIWIPNVIIRPIRFFSKNLRFHQQAKPLPHWRPPHKAESRINLLRLHAKIHVTTKPIFQAVQNLSVWLVLKTIIYLLLSFLTTCKLWATEKDLRTRQVVEWSLLSDNLTLEARTKPPGLRSYLPSRNNPYTVTSSKGVWGHKSNGSCERQESSVPRRSRSVSGFTTGKYCTGVVQDVEQ